MYKTKLTTKFNLGETLVEDADTEVLQEGSDGIELISITDEMKCSYLDYVMSIIVNHALPDGLNTMR